MADIKWLEDNRLQIAPPKRTKKITGTRFATILGLNPWSTEFEMWCAITKTFELPFEDTIYTIAGKTIEPKQAEYMKKSYGMELISPTDRYGADYFNKTWGDFFPDSPHLGGMWDFLGVDEDGKVDTVLEMKTTKRIEDWQNDVPEYYALQAALYAYLLGVDNVIMVASFLDEKDYADPSKYVPNIKNTISSAISTGSCNSVANLTGRPAGTDGKVDVVWRGIEGLWGNVWEWVDGVNWNNGAYYVCNDPSKYADDTATNYTALSFTGATNWSSSYITEEGLDTGNNAHVMLPAAAGSGSESTFDCDACWSSTSWRVFPHGGYWSDGSRCGLFTASLSGTSSYSGTDFGSRLLYIPS